MSDESDQPLGERVLVVDDEPGVVEMVSLALGSAGIAVEIATSGREALEAARRIRPDVILLDVMMQDLGGIEVCRELRRDARTAASAVIMVSALGEPEARVTGLEAGADDYLAKPFDPAELTARVRAVIRRTHQLRATSPLTGLPGNFDIERQLDLLAAGDGPPFALAHADLDYFKAYNDHYGFLRGDQALKVVAGLLVEIVDEEEPDPRFLGHVGGDDFAFVVHPDRVDAVCRRIIDDFGAVRSELYDAVDLDRGHIEVLDRRGTTHRFPLLDISVGVATNAHRAIASATEASAIANEMKRLAKSIPGSCWRTDRRNA